MCVVDGTYVLGNFQDQSLTSLGNLDLEGVQNLRKLLIELNINDGTDNGGDFSGAECGSGGAVGTDTRWFSRWEARRKIERSVVSANACVL